MTEKQVRWLRWWWRVAGASYLAGVVTMFSYSSVIVFWTAILFTPLLVATLWITRSRFVAMIGIPVIVMAIFASIQLLSALRATGQLPNSTAFRVVWFIATFGPIALYLIVGRHLKAAGSRGQST